MRYSFSFIPKPTKSHWFLTLSPPTCTTEKYIPLDLVNYLTLKTSFLCEYSLVCSDLISPHDTLALSPWYEAASTIGHFSIASLCSFVVTGHLTSDIARKQYLFLTFMDQKIFTVMYNLFLEEFVVQYLLF